MNTQLSTPQKNNKENYSVGQVLFLLSSKSKELIPVKIVKKEKQISEEINQPPKEVISYKVIAGTNDANQVSLSELDGEKFITIQDAKKYLLDKLSSQIERLASDGLQKAKNWYNYSENSVVNIQTLPSSPTELQAPMLTIDPSDLLLTKQQMSNPSLEIEQEEDISSKEEYFITLPDGSKAKARFRGMNITND